MKGLVDGLCISKDCNTSGLCEDCIYGKQTTCPFNGMVMPEKDPLERLHIDLWGRSRVQSIGGANYMFVIIDGATSYKTVLFLADKGATTTLDAFKTFVTEAQRQTGKKLKRIRADMGREWVNNKWSTWTKSGGVVMESGAPYAHSSNGVAECGIRTIINGTRTLLFEAGLPPSLWAEVASTIVYTLNFTPSSRHPGVIPAEAWTGK